MKGFLFDAARRAEEAGVAARGDRARPGHRLRQVGRAQPRAAARHGDLAAAGYPVLIGVSRKSLFGELFGLALEERVEAGLAAAVACVLRGARIVRTHDVRATARALRVAEALL